MLPTIHDDTRNVLNIQHITPNSKRWDYSDIPSGGHKKIKGPAYMVEGSSLGINVDAEDGHGETSPARISL